MILSDLSLSRRLERAEAVANARFVEARARVAPDVGARWIEVAGTHAMFDGVRSPSTQTFGLGLFEPPTAPDLDRIEAFFRERGAPVLHEVSPLAGQAPLALLSERGYRPVELTSVMYLTLPAPEAAPTEVRVRIAGLAERDLWARTSTDGWRDASEFADIMFDLMRVVSEREDLLPFLAELEGRPVAAGALAIHQGVALLAGASTIPEWRHRGAQRALLAGRLAYAAEAGCDLAMIGAEPGGGSQRNAEREGFRIAYTRTKWCLTSGPGK